MEDSFERDGFNVRALAAVAPSGEVQVSYDIEATTDVAKKAFLPKHGAVDGYRAVHAVRPTGITFNEQEGLALAVRQANDLIDVMLGQTGYHRFDPPVTFRRQSGSQVHMSHTKSALDFLESLPEEYKFGINFEASLGSLHRAHVTGDPSDLRQARKDLGFFVSQAPGFKG
jgi:hypothetical protein